MTGDLVRLAGSLAQCEMALVRRDAVAAALIAQAARHAEGLPEEALVTAAARLTRSCDLTGGTAEAAAARKAAQALVRAAVIGAEAGLLR